MAEKSWLDWVDKLVSESDKDYSEARENFIRIESFYHSAKNREDADSWAEVYNALEEKCLDLGWHDLIPYTIQSGGTA